MQATLPAGSPAWHRQGARRRNRSHQPTRLTTSRGLVSFGLGPKLLAMFVVDDATAEAIRRAWQEQGELSALIELRRHFPLLADNAGARRCLHAIPIWTPRPAPETGRH